VDDDPTAGNSNRTIQVDALADVELLDQDSESMEADAAVAPGPARPPPPLPYRRPNLIIIGVVVLLAGGLGAVGAYLIPNAEPTAVAPATAPAPVETAPAETAPAETAPAEEEVIRHVPLGEEFIIRFDEDAGLPPSE
jgi:hypothetical protein